MKDDVELLLENMTPCGAPPELRERVLNAVAQELSTKLVPAWEQRVGTMVAAAVLLGVALNIWAVKTNERRLADLAGPQPLAQQLAEIVEIVESVTGSETGEWVQEQVLRAWSSRPAAPPPSRPDLERLINDLEISGKVQLREKVQEVPEKRGDRPGRADRDSFDRQRDPHFHFRQTA